MLRKKRMTGAALLAAAMLVTACGGASTGGNSAGGGPSGIDVPYAFECIHEFNGNITITGYRGTFADPVIPEKINGLPVAYIGWGAFRDEGLTKITIPASVTTIRTGAFSGNNLTSVTIGANVNLWDEVFGWDSSSSFYDVYNNGGKLAGTYTRPDTNSETWTKQ